MHYSCMEQGCKVTRSKSVCSKRVLDAAGIVVELLLEPCNRVLRVATGQVQRVLGKVLVDVSAKGQSIPQLDLFVVGVDFPSLFGRTWIEAFCGENWLDKLWGNTVPEVNTVNVQISDVVSKSQNSIGQKNSEISAGSD